MIFGNKGQGWKQHNLVRWYEYEPKDYTQKQAKNVFQYFNTTKYKWQDQ